MKYESKLKISRVILNHFSSSHVCIWLRYRCSFGSEFIAKTYLMRPAWCEMSISGSFDAFVISLLFTSNTITHNRQSRNRNNQLKHCTHTSASKYAVFSFLLVIQILSIAHTGSSVTFTRTHTHFYHGFRWDFVPTENVQISKFFGRCKIFTVFSSFLCLTTNPTTGALGQCARFLYLNA